MADRNRQPTTTTSTTHQSQAIDEEAINTAPPPPYSDSNSDADEDYEPPQKVVINAEHKITGVGNLVPTNPSALANAAKLSAILFKAITQLNNVANANATADGQTRPLHVDLTINCGVTVYGSRNVVGGFAIRRKETVAEANAAEVVLGAQGTVAGAKRKVDDEVSL